MFIGAPLQYAFGMAGVAMTELLILVCAVVPALVAKRPLRDVFPMRKPTSREIGGTLCALGGFWGLSIFCAMLSLYLMPTEMAETADAMQNLFTASGFVISMIVVAIMPAVCEEMLYRGAIMYSFGRIRPWMQMLLVGLLFGIFHWDPTRFLSTGVLGVGLAYIMLKSENLLLPMIFHFCNNAFSLLANFLLNAALQNSPAADYPTASLDLPEPQLLLFSLIYVVGAPALIVIAGVLLEPRRPSVRGRFRDKRPHIIAASVIGTLALVGFVAGIVTMARTIPMPGWDL